MPDNVISASYIDSSRYKLKTFLTSSDPSAVST